MYGVAKGIRFLHYDKEKPLIHRDIKSANVLLDNQMIPKVCFLLIMRHIAKSKTFNLSILPKIALVFDQRHLT